MILAIHGGHNASVALIKTTSNNTIKCYCIESERFDRIKMSPGCDRYDGKDFSPKNKSFWINNHKRNFEDIVMAVLNEADATYSDIEQVILTQGLDLNRLPAELLKKEIQYIAHHEAHAALSYYTSDFNDAVVIVCDGSGEKTEKGFEIQTAWYCKDNSMSMISSTYKSNTYKMGIGNAYELYTYWLGYGYNGCGTTMALASFNSTKKKPTYDIFKFFSNGDIFLNEDFINIESYVKKTNYIKNGTMAYNKAHEEMLRSVAMPNGYKLRNFNESSLQPEFIEMASDIQIATENAVIEYLYNTLDKVESFSGNLCMSGGTFLNCNLNTKIRHIPNIKDIHVPTAPGDGGLAVGAALSMYFRNNPRCAVENTAYIGRKIHNDILQDNEFIEIFTPDNVFEETARLISKGYLVGWCQAEAEFGPRALGHRSIVADPCNPKSPDMINARIKHREAFRPFAPAVLEDDYDEYFQGPLPIPYMLETRKIKEDYQNKLSAVCHVDKSARVQVVSKDNCKEFYNLLCEFKKITGISVLINTSLNRNGEPIVDSCEDAIKLLKENLLDYLVINNQIYYLKGNKYAPKL